ncbi:MAG TPA: hypothetical protein VJ123_07845 [Anaerolineales bacterium]|nr:hypothetical protein [Anaerolineales bacterium]
MKPQSIASLNLLPEAEKAAVYRRFIPARLTERFSIAPSFLDVHGLPLLDLRCHLGATDVVLSLRHRVDAQDPVLYAHLTDTMNGQIHVLLYILNDPDSPRFDVDRMPDGTPTEFGALRRNIAAEAKAMRSGLTPGQVRQGLRLLRDSIAAFEEFVSGLGHDMYFVEPLYYHNAVIFERHGFSYQIGRKLMERIHAGFQEGGDLARSLDGSTEFRAREHADSIRGRSWAIHDGVLGGPYTQVTMYKHVGLYGSVDTFPGGTW